MGLRIYYLFSDTDSAYIRLALGQIIRRLEVNKKCICNEIVECYSSATGGVVAARLMPAHSEREILV